MFPLRCVALRRVGTRRTQNLDVADLDDLGLDSVTLGEVQQPIGKRILWQHITKCAGSFICSVLEHKGNVVKPSRNCAWNEGDDDRYRSIASLSHREPENKCRKRYNYFVAHGYGSGLIEREINDDDFCSDDFSYGTFVRDPLSQMVSWTNFASFFQSHDVHKYIPQLKEAVRVGKNWTVGSNHGNVFGWEFYDNYIVRVLGGTETFNVPPGQITQEHLERAKRHLQQMDFIAVIEKDGISNKDIVRLSNFIGCSIDAKRKVNARPHKVAFTQDEHDFLMDLNKWSTKLVDYVRTIV